MKKILTIALVALLAASSVFAGLSGYSNLGFGYNSKSGKFGFNPSSALSIDLDVATAEGSNIGEGDIYAGIDASVTLKLIDTMDVKKALIATDKWNDSNSTGYYSVGVFAAINSAYIAGQDWKVSFGTASSNPVNFASSAIDTYKNKVWDTYHNAWADVKKSAVSYSAPYVGSNGLAATYKDYTVGIGFDGFKSGDDVLMEYTGYVLTPEIALGDASVKFGGVFSQGYTEEDDGSYTKNKPNAGASLQAAYATDKFSAKAAADFGLENIGAEDGNKFHFDAAANFKYDFVSADVYYADYFSTYEYKIDGATGVVLQKTTATEYENLLSAKASVDLKSFDVPVALTLTGKNLINTQDLSAEVKVSVSEAFSFKIKGGYVIKDKKLTAGGTVEYKAEKFTASAEASFTLKDNGEKQLYPTVVVSSDALVNGATLELSWKPVKDYAGDTKTNLLDSSKDFGQIYATAKLAF